VVFIAADLSHSQEQKVKKGTAKSSTAEPDIMAADDKDADLKNLKTEVFIAKTENEAILQAQKLLKKYKGTQLEPDLIFRIAELYIRKAKTDRFLEIHRQSETLVQLMPKLAKTANAKANTIKAISYYDDIQKRWPNYNRMDEVFFNNAIANQQIENESRAEKLYLLVIKEYPGSSLVPDSHLAVGEMHFRKKNFDKALAHFTAIRNFPNSVVYPYGMYKAGWTRYNLRDAMGGLRELEDVVAFGHMVQEKGIDSRLDLRKEALMDMALFYEDALPAKDAFKYFEKHTKKLEVAPYILKLSTLYKRHSRHSDVRTILSEYIESRPTSESLPLAYVEMLDASDKLKQTRDVVNLMENFYALCRQGSKWVKSQDTLALNNKDNPLQDLIDEPLPNLTPEQVCVATFKKETLKYANRWLKIWKTNNKEVDYANVTEKAFEIYLRDDNKTEESGKARFIYAELLFQRNKFREASFQYATAAEALKDKVLKHDARYYAMIALEKAVADKWSDKDEELFVKYAKLYLQDDAKAKFAADIEFKIGFIAYEKGRYNEAAPIFKRVGEIGADTERGKKAQDLYLDILNIKKQYPDLRDYAFDLRKKAKDNDRIAKLTKIYEEAYFLIVQGYEEKGEVQKAVDLYNQFASTNPSSPLAQKANWNAMQIEYKEGNYLAAAGAAIAFASRYPKEQQSIDALMKAAQVYESMAQLSLAADVLLKLSSLDKAASAKWELLAADFLMLDGKASKAKALYEKLAKSEEAATIDRALIQLEKIALLENNIKEREMLLKRMIATGRQPQLSLAEVYFLEKVYASKDYSEAFSMAKKIMGTQKAGADKSALARARLIQARILAQEYKQQSVKAQIDRVSIVLQLKTEKLSRAQEAYQSAAQYGNSEVTLTAFNELGDLYLDYSAALRNMPVPAGVDPNEEAVFRGEMDKLAFPMEERGIESKVAALRQARANGTNLSLIKTLEKEVEKLNQQVSSEGLVRFEGQGILLPKKFEVGT
jgi:TolA-binding protein